MSLISINVHQTIDPTGAPVRRPRRRALVVGTIAVAAVAAAGGLAAATGSVPSTPSTFTAISPAHVLTNKVLAAATETHAVVAGGASAVPAAATSVELSVTVSGGTTAGTLEVYAFTTGTPAPSIQWSAGQAETVQLTVPVGSGGKVTFKNLAGSVTVSASTVGYYLAAATTSTTYTTSPTSASFLWNSQYVFETSAGSYTEYFTRYDTIATPALTQDVLNNGSVQVYFTPSPVNNPNMWVPLPYQFDSSFGFTYNFVYVTSPGAVTLHFYFIQTDPNATVPQLSTFAMDSYHFKIVVTPGDGAAQPASAQQPRLPAHVTCTAIAGGKTCHAA